MPMKILLLASVGLAWPVVATADPLDCTDMEYAVQEILVERMQISQFLGLDTAEAAGATFQMNYFHAERREYNRTFCSAIINFNRTRFAEAVRRSAEIKKMQALQGLAKFTSVGELARYVNFPAGVRVLYKLELIENGRNWVVTLLNDPATDHICALPDRHRYMEEGRPCVPSLPREELQWRRSGAVDTGLPDVADVDGASARPCGILNSPRS